MKKSTPFLVLLDRIKKSSKFIGSKKRRITASILCFITMVMSLPMEVFPTFEVSAETTASITDPATLQIPILGTGMTIFNRLDMFVYYGQYPQDTSNANNMQPIKWQVWARNLDLHGSKYTYSCTGAIGLAATKVLDTAKWIENPGKKWKIEDDKWLVSYDASALNSFLRGTFLPKAFSAEERAVMSTQKIVTFGGTFHPSLGGSVPHESGEYKVYVPCLQHDGGENRTTPRYIANVPATVYAASKNCATYTGNGITYGTHWYRTHPVSNYASSFKDAGVVRMNSSYTAYMNGARANTYGVRPFTRVMGEDILLVSAIGTKNNETVTNAEMPQENGNEYKLTVRDASRTFNATKTGDITYNADSFRLNLSYTGAKVGADEAISYIITDRNDNVYQYKRVRTSTSSTDTINLDIPYSSFLGDHCKVKVFNEKLSGGKYTDYGSAFSTFEISKPHTHLWDTKWTRNETHHWHECNALDCEVTDNIEKGSYSAHSYTEEIVKPEALKSQADPTTPAIYYKSCVCGIIGTSETFSYGIPADHLHDDGGYFSKMDSSFTGGTLTPGNYYLDSDISLNETMMIKNGTVNLCLNGHNIKQTGNGSVIEIKKEATLTLHDCSLNHSGCITGSSNNSGILNSGTFTMNGGNITGNSGTWEGGGVYSSGTFVMNSGRISNNSSRYNGGGVKIYTGDFTMNGGSILDNVCTNEGGGVSFSYGDFTMNDGMITGNTSGFRGGGVVTATSSNGTVDVGGTAAITGNITKSGSKTIQDNLFLNSNKVKIATGFLGSIGISGSPVPTGDTPMDISYNNNLDYSKCFFSDNDAYEVVNARSMSNQVLRLVSKHEHQWPDTWSRDEKHHWKECSICHMIQQNGAHTPEEDDHDCSTEIQCSLCGAQTFPAKSHNFSETLLHDEEGHWHPCINSGCTVTDTKVNHEWIEGTPNPAPTYFMEGERIDTCICGETKTVVLPMIVDNIDPSGDIKIGTNSVRKLLNTISFGLFFKDQQQVTITAADAESGVKSTQYYLSTRILGQSEILSISSWVTYSNPILMNPNDKYVVYAKITDYHNNVVYLGSDGITIDNVAPVITGLEEGKTYCISKDFTIQDDNLDTVKVNGAVIHPNEGKYTLTNSGANVIMVTDKAGNSATVTVTINSTHTPEADDHDCSTAIHCSVCGEVTTPAKTHDFSGALLHDEEGHWHECAHSGCTVTDAKVSHEWTLGTPNPAPTYFEDGERIDTCICGETKTVVLPMLVDSMKPTGDIKIGTYSVKKQLNAITFGSFFNNQQQVTITSSDAESGVQSTQYYLSTEILNQNELEGISSWVEYSNPILLNPKDRYVVYVKITDKHNNVMYLGSDGVTIDDDPPVLSGLVDGATYCISKEFIVAEEYLDSVRVNGVVIDQEEGKYHLTGSGGSIIVVTDKAGNRTTVAVKINSTHTPEADDHDCSTEVHCLVCGEVTTPSQNHDFSGALLHDEEGHWHQCTHSDCTVTDTKVSHEWTLGTPNPAPTYFKDGERIDTCICGETKTVVLPMLIDNNAPTGTITIGTNSWNSFFNTISFGVFFKNTQSVTVTSEDRESGVDKTFYYLSHKPLSEAEARTVTEWVEYNGSFSLNPNNSYVVYVKITDKVGNSSILSTEGVVLDNILPVISGATDGKTYCAEVVVTVTDDNLDTVTLDGKTITLTDGKFTVTPTDKTQTITVTDKARNEKSVSITVNSTHTWDEGVITLPPTTSQKGIRAYTCIHCEETRTEEIDMLPPEVIEGQNSSWKPHEGGTLYFRSNAAFSDFISVLVNGKVVDSKYYELKEGSIIVMLKPEYLATLPTGTYTLGIKSVTGIASTQFTIMAKEEGKESPKTGDNSNMLLWFTILFLSGGVLTVIGFKSKKEK